MRAHRKTEGAVISQPWKTQPRNVQSGIDVYFGSQFHGCAISRRVFQAVQCCAQGGNTQPWNWLPNGIEFQGCTFLGCVFHGCESSARVGNAQPRNVQPGNWLPKYVITYALFTLTCTYLPDYVND